MNEESLKQALAELPIPEIRYFDTIGSTNDEALAWISAAGSASGAADGCLVVADSQSQGRGRLGRKWVTRPGAGLAFSLVLRPSLQEVERVGYLSPLGALAVCQALEDIGLTPQIKWPNDILLNRRKAAGILVEAAWLGEKLEGMVIGIGLNIAPESVPPAGDLLFPAISVQEAAGRAIDRLALLRSILTNLFAWRARLFDPAFFAAWDQRLAFRGEWVTLKESGKPVSPRGEQPEQNGVLTGQLAGIDSAGRLLLRTPAGDTVTVSVGDLHLRPVDPPSSQP